MIISFILHSFFSWIFHSYYRSFYFIRIELNIVHYDVVVCDVCVYVCCVCSFVCLRQAYVNDIY